MKCTQEEYNFHQRILGGDPVAFAELAERLYSDLVRETGIRARSRSTVTVEMDLIEEAVGQALLDYNDHPQRYDPEQASMKTYLVMAAYGDYLNLQSKEWRHLRRKAAPQPAKEGQSEGEREWEIADSRQDLEALLTRISAEELWPLVEEAFPDHADRQMVVLMMNGVRATHSYARVLGLSGPASDEQAREVKRVKDRIAKRLRRLGEAHDERA